MSVLLRHGRRFYLQGLRRECGAAGGCFTICRYVQVDRQTDKHRERERERVRETETETGTETETDRKTDKQIARKR